MDEETNVKRNGAQLDDTSENLKLKSPNPTPRNTPQKFLVTQIALKNTMKVSHLRKLSLNQSNKLVRL